MRFNTELELVRLLIAVTVAVIFILVQNVC